MKKIILSLAIAIATSFGMMAMSQNPESTTRTELSAGKKAVGKHKHGKKDDSHGDKKDKKKGDKKDGKKAMKGQKRPEVRPINNPFQGIELTEQQKSQLSALQTSLKPQRISEEDKAKLSDEQKKALKEEQKVKRQNFKKDYLAGLKTILTPEQYVQFLENNYLQNNNKDLKKASKKGKQIRQPMERRMPQSQQQKAAQ